MNQTWEEVKAWHAKRRARLELPWPVGTYWRSVERYHACRRWVNNVPGQLRWARQRVVRGWDDRAVWSVHDHLARQLGEQLVEMARISHGYPPDYPAIPGAGAFDHFCPDAPSDDGRHSDWVRDLRKHGEALLAFHRAGAACEDEIEAYAGAQEALRWVADHFADLWD